MQKPVLRDHWPREVRQRANELIAEDPEPSLSQIAKRLEEELGSRRDDGQDPLPTPSPRALGDWRENGWLKRLPGNAPWRYDRVSPADAALVVETTRALADVIGGLFGPSITTARARAIARLRRVVPDCDDLAWVWTMAELEAWGELECVQAALVLQPWRDGGARLARAVELGRAPALLGVTWVRYRQDRSVREEIERPSRQLEQSFRRMGLSESAARIAARPRDADGQLT